VHSVQFAVENRILAFSNAFSTFFVIDTTRKTRIVDVVYNASNNELVRTKTLVKNAIVLVDATPFRTWYEAHYGIPLGRKKGAKLVSEDFWHIIS
jgi:ribosomal protein S8E